MLLALTLTACDIPRDPESTLNRVSGGTMRVGVSANEPWVILDGPEPAGVEVEIIEGFAASIDAEIEWFPGTEEELAAALHSRELDVLLGGIESTSVLAAEVTLTHPYLTTASVVGVPQDSDIREDITGVEVAVEAGTEEAALLDKTDAIPVRVEDIAAGDGAKATDSWLLDDLGLKDTGVRLAEHDHVLAVPGGENAWLTRLERYLLSHESEIEGFLGELGAP